MTKKYVREWGEPDWHWCRNCSRWPKYMLIDERDELSRGTQRCAECTDLAARAACDPGA